MPPSPASPYQPPARRRQGPQQSTPSPSSRAQAQQDRVRSPRSTDKVQPPEAAGEAAEPLGTRRPQRAFESAMQQAVQGIDRMEAVSATSPTAQSRTLAPFSASLHALRTPPDTPPSSGASSSQALAPTRTARKAQPAPPPGRSSPPRPTWTCDLFGIEEQTLLDAPNFCLIDWT